MALLGKMKAAAIGMAGVLVAAPLTRRVPKIFMYHRFSHGMDWGRLSAQTLARQMNLLKQSATVVSMDEIAQAYHGRIALPSNAVALTIDDGYADFFEVAMPVFEKYRVPVTLYIATSLIDRNGWYWTDRLKWSLLQSKRRSAAVDMGTHVAEYPLDSADSRHTAWSDLADRALALGEDARGMFLESVFEALETFPPDVPPSEYRLMSWADIKDACTRGVTIGSHTLTHARLSSLEDQPLRHEIFDSKARIEDELQTAVRHFCYPFGSVGDYDCRGRDFAAAAGYESAVTAIGDGDHVADVYDLRRYGVSESMDDFVRSLRGLKLVRRHGPFWSQAKVFGMRSPAQRLDVS